MLKLFYETIDSLSGKIHDDMQESKQQIGTTILAKWAKNKGLIVVILCVFTIYQKASRQFVYRPWMRNVRQAPY